MTAGSSAASTEFDWEAAGRTLSAELGRINAVAILGSDDVATARVAIGIARYQSRRKRVAIGDLLGDADPLQQLAPSDDSHGLADVFEYGVSMDKIARRVVGNASLFLLPTGTFLTDFPEIFANRRWSRLAAGFREEDGVLVIAANAQSPGIESLVVQLDGAVLVGGMVPARLPVARVLGRVAGPDGPPALTAPRPPATRPQYVIRRGPGRLWIGVLFALFLGLLGGGSAWFAHRPAAPTWLRSAFRVGPSVAQLDSLKSASDTNAVAAIHMGLLTARDSASRAPYGLSLVAFNTQAGALLELRRNSSTLRAGTFTPVLIRETPWFRVVAGAYPDSAAAAALLDTLRSRGMSDAGRAAIDRFPYALLIERGVPDSAVSSRVSAYQTRGLPVYALLQSDGTARLFAGAFKAKEEATLLADAMRTANVPTTLAYRTGRVY